jgi:integrase
MASLRRKEDSKYWFACFALKNGTRTQRSTKETDRKKAQKIAEEFERAARKEMTARQAQHVIAELYRNITGDTLQFPTVREYFESWLARKKPEIAPSSYQAYSRTAAYFLACLGERANKQITLLSRADVLAFRKAELERVSPSTVNDEIKHLRMVFKSAREDGDLQENPADTVRPARESASGKRRAFTLPELRRVIKQADDEWRSLIFFGLYTGQRLGDLARLTWQNIDLDRDEISFVSGKTGRQMIIPLAPPLRENIESLPAGEDPRQRLHPRAFAHVEKSAGRVGTLSRQFYDLLADAGLAAPRSHRRLESAPGRDGRRRMSEISFHALRHTATSLMKNAGISPAIVQDIIGHESAAVSAHYTHVDEAVKRRAMAALPKI